MNLSLNQKYILCILVTIISVIVIFCLAPLPQDPAYHNFIDQRTIFGIPNFWNVISNLPFLLVALVGLKKINSVKGLPFGLGYILIAGIFLTGLGSSWYHLSPSNHSLVWDRLPMTIAFMSLFSFIILDRIGENVAKALMFPLLTLGIFSVFYWDHTESLGRGDLRLYGLVQFFPLLMIPMMMVLFKGHRSINKEIGWMVALYIGAKLFEHFDPQIYSIGGLMSGHAIKHVIAAWATWYIVKILEKPMIGSQASRSS